MLQEHQTVHYSQGFVDPEDRFYGASLTGASLHLSRPIWTCTSFFKLLSGEIKPKA